MESIEPNNFEDQVKNKMDGLKIHPKESAWLNIEKRISNKGKRRKIAFLLFFIALFLLSGGYWLFNSGINFKTIANNQAQEVIKEDSQKARAEKKDSSVTHLKFSDKQSITKVESKAPEKKVGLSEKIVKYGKPKGWKNLKIVPVTFSNKSRGTSEEESNKLTSDEVSIHEGKSSDSTDNKNKTLSKSDFEINSEQKKYPIEKTGLDTIKENTISEKLINKPKSELANNKENSKEKSPVIKNQKNKWQRGLTVSGGTSLIGNDPFGLENNTNYFSDPSNSGTGPGSVPYQHPSKVKNSVAFIGGVFIEKNISQRLRMSFGINYKYFSALSKTGFKIDSLQTAYYNSQSDSKNYRNSFHFVEVPVTLKVLLNNKKSLPLYWKAGVSISQLISSNALQFKTDPGVYYIDNSLFNKTQLGFSTGLSMTLMSKQKYPVSIGPEIYYGISGIALDGLYKKKHFSFIGISAEILVRNK